ncbi:MAG TPA: PspA/IM30 family protein [Acidimicrobiales bacterium]|nr:PspA/IM30 family protein [Acidimicrobiales bacterium]
MGFWQRLSTIFQAKGNRALDRLEDPRETLDLSYDKQLENLTKVRRAVADVATARKRIELQANELKKQGDKLQSQAKAALAQGNEDLARVALERRTVVAGQLGDLEAQHQQVADQEQRLIETSRRLQAEVEAFRTRKETIKATYTAAEAQTHISEAVTGISSSMSDAGAAMQRAQDKIAQMQARSGAMDELIQSGALTDLSHPVDDIQAQLDRVSTTAEVDNELERLKAELGASSAPAAELEGGGAATDKA